MAENLYKRGPVWWGRLWLRGQEHRRSLRTRSLAIARRRLADWRVELDRVRWDGHERATYKQAFILWSEVLDSGTVKAGTAKRYRVSGRILDPYLRDLFLDEIDRRKIGEIVKARRDAKVTNASIRRDLTALSSLFEAAISGGLCEDNPARTWNRSVIRERRDPINPPTRAEIDTVIGYAPEGLGRLIRFAAETGVRQEEAAALEWRHITKSGTVTLLLTKASRTRTIALKSPGGDAGTITGTPRHSKEPWVFWHDDGARYSNVASRFSQIMARAVAAETKAGRPLRRFRFHDLRHAFAIRWLANGGEIYALKTHLGHTSVKTTEIYLRWVAGHENRHSDGGSKPAQSAVAKVATA